MNKKAYDARAVALVGVKHAGKSSVGAHLAELLELPFLDGDALIVEVARAAHPEVFTAHSVTARDVYRELGEQTFRLIEEQTLCFLPEAYVLAAGGGLADCPAAWDALRGACIVLLDISAQAAWSRITAQGGAGLPQFVRDAENPEAAFATICARRIEIYKAHAHIICGAEDAEPRRIAETIAARLRAA